MKQAVEKLNDSLAKLDDILGKVREGKSVAGGCWWTSARGAR